MRYAEAPHYLRGYHLVKGLLAERPAAAFDQAAFSVYDLPAFFLIAVGGDVGRVEIGSFLLIRIMNGVLCNAAFVLGWGFGVWTDVVYFRIFSKIYNILW